MSGFIYNGSLTMTAFVVDTFLLIGKQWYTFLINAKTRLHTQLNPQCYRMLQLSYTYKNMDRLVIQTQKKRSIQQLRKIRITNETKGLKVSVLCICSLFPQDSTFLMLFVFSSFPIKFEALEQKRQLLSPVSSRVAVLQICSMHAC